MYSTKTIHVDSLVELIALLKDRKREKNFQWGVNGNGRIYKQSAVSLETIDDKHIIHGHYYLEGKHSFKFDIDILDINKRKFSLSIHKKNVNIDDVNLIYDEIVELKKALFKRNNQKGGNPRPQELYLESGRISTDRARMRYVQAHLDGKYPSELLSIYKEMNFKISGHGKYPDLKNWKDEALKLGIAL